MGTLDALVATGLAGAAGLSVIVSTATQGWIVLKVEFMGQSISAGTGLFTACASGVMTSLGSNCQSTITDGPSDMTICDGHTVGALNAMVRFTQCVAVMSILAAGFAGLMTLIRLFGKAGYPLIGILASSGCALLCILTVVMFVATLNYGGCGTMLCDVACSSFPSGYGITCSCGYNYSFGLCIVGMIFCMLGAIFQFRSRAPPAAAAGVPMVAGVINAGSPTSSYAPVMQASTV